MSDCHRGPASRGEPPFDRRDALRLGVASLFTLGLGGGARAYAGRLFAPAAPSGPARAQRVVHVFLQGGLSHLDSFDPKPYAAIEVRGEYGTAPASLAGECLAEPLARIAKILDKVVLLRGMNHGEAAHERAVAHMHTGYSPSPAIAYPSEGSVVAHELGGRENLPAYVAIPDAREPALGTGYLGSAFAPFSVGGEPANGNFAVRDLEPQPGIDLERLRRRRSLVQAIDARFGSAEADVSQATDAFSEQAYALIDSPKARSAFDIKAEAKEMRDRYGRTQLGQRLLLARRLVEGGVRWVTVTDVSFDFHNEIFRGMRPKLDALDIGLAALLGDLEERGLLDSTLVLVTTEFGRTSIVNRDRGRDHWPRVFSGLAAGGGLKRGVVHGASTAAGTDVDRDGVTPADLAATVFTLLGIDPEKRLMSPGDRPIDIVRDGRVIREIVA